jgi:hypothetical protein
MNLFDPLLIITILVLIFYALKYKKIKLLYTFLRGIFIFAFATKYAFSFSVILTSWHILDVETTIGSQFLIGFGVGVFLIIYVIRLAEYIFSIINSGKFSYLTYISNFIIVSLSVIIVVTTSVFLLMQVTFIKKYSQTYINKSKTYPYIRKTYTNLFSTKFVKTNIIARSPSFL